MLSKVAVDFEIQQETQTTSFWIWNQTTRKTNKSNWSNNSAIVSVCVELLNCCCLLFNCCLLLKQSLTLGGAVQEPWDTTIVTCFHFGGSVCLTVFSHSFVQQQKHICHQTDPQKDPQIDPKPGPGPILFDFLHPLFLMACAVFLIDVTASTCSKTHKNLNKHKALKRQWKHMSNSAKKTEIFRNRLPGNVKMGAFILGNFNLTSLMISLTSQCIFVTNKIRPIFSQNHPKVANVIPQGIPKS